MASPDLYGILGISRNATNSDIKKAYKRLAMECHPDRNANANANEQFKELGFAYSVLSDPQKRARYDRFGLDAVKEGGESSSPFGDGGMFFNMFGGGGGGGIFGMHDMNEMFDVKDILFGGMGGMGGPRMRRKEDTVHGLDVTLEDLYIGKHIVLPITREVICIKCSGKGGRAVQNCTQCKGQGIKVTIRQVPGGYTQSHGKCVNCNGQGHYVIEKDKCGRCKGRKTLRSTASVNVHIQPGMQHGQKIEYEKMGDEGVGMMTGSFVVVLNQLAHPVYKLSGVNLKVKLDVSITEALCGFETVIKHLDGRNLVIRTAPGEILKPGCMKTILGEGMRRYRTPQHGKGHIVVYFNIVFPENHFTDHVALEAMERLLPPRPVAPVIPDEDLEQVEMYDYKVDEGDSSRSRSEAYHEDQDDDMAGGGMRCAHQ